MGAAGDDDAQARSDGGWRMNRIDELLAQLCPEGVEFRALGDFGELVRGNGMPKSDFVESGVGCIHYGQVYTYYGIWATETISFVVADKAARLAKVEPGDLIITNTSENVDDVCKAVAWIGDTQIVTGGHATVLKHDQDPKYLSYYLRTPHFLAEKRKHATGTKVIDVSAKSLAKIRIPIPPLAVQREIVKVLDAFTALEAELEAQLAAELAARRRQYQHYRDALLSFGELRSENGEWRIGAADDAVAQARGDEVRWMALGEVASFHRGTAITEKQTTEGDIPVVANGPTPVYSHGESNREGETVVVARSGVNAGFVSYWNQPIFLTDAFSVHPDTTILTPCFVFRFLQSKQEVVHSMKKGSGVPHVQVKEMQRFQIPIPPLEEQARIVAILDQFDALVNDLSRGLPAEIAARRQQYAHYRDRLLTFSEAA
jgi:type I restriction enzyme S subunit